MSLIRLDRVSKSFLKTGKVVDELSLEIKSGEFVIFLGASGCGKSTLLRLIAGLELPDQGQIENQVASQMSFVFQEANLLPWRTVEENVRLPLELGSGSESEKSAIDGNRIAEALTLVGLSDAASKRPHELSGGMKMRVSLARAMVTRPRLLLLDEPFAALDEITRFKMQEDLRALWKSSSVTIVFVTHSMSEAAFLGTRQIVLTPRPARIATDHASDLEDQRDLAFRSSSHYLTETRFLQSILMKSGQSGVIL